MVERACNAHFAVFYMSGPVVPSSSNAVLLRQPLSEGGRRRCWVYVVLHRYVPHGRVPCVISSCIYHRLNKKAVGTNISFKTKTHVSENLHTDYRLNKKIVATKIQILYEVTSSRMKLWAVGHFFHQN